MEGGHWYLTMSLKRLQSISGGVRPFPVAQYIVSERLLLDVLKESVVL